MNKSMKILVGIILPHVALFAVAFTFFVDAARCAAAGAVMISWTALIIAASKTQ